MPRRLYGKQIPQPSDVPEGSQMEEQIPEANEPTMMMDSPDTEMGFRDVGANTISGMDAQDIPRHDVPLEAQGIIGINQIHEAARILQEYKSGKAVLESNTQKNELWYQMRQWEEFHAEKTSNEPRSTSAWLFDSIANKHADAMDNYPEPIVLPRERSDEESAKTLTSILPVVMEYNKFKRTYRDNWWEKIKHGTAIYGVFWDSTKENSLGDISVKAVDIMKIFWQPGITNIQESRNVFVCELVDTDLLEEMYPKSKGKLSGQNIQITQYLYDDSIDTTSNKSLVVDWYYKVKNASGKTVLHYCKFCCDEVLYASENDPELRERGFYDHGKFPFVFDILYPAKGTPAGFGYISIWKGAQIYIDQLSSNIQESSLANTKKRYFISESTAMNEEEFADWNKPFVHVNGELGEHRIQEIVSNPINPVYLNVLQMKQEELKETSANRDVNNGGASNVSAAAAISALQEAGNKRSRDIIDSSYEAYQEICELCIELMRQFYDETRAFRVTGNNEAQFEFMEINNSQLRDQPVGMDMLGNTLFRKPVFDLKIKAQKRNPFSTMEANTRAQELYGMGFFNPDRATEAIAALEMMEFEGIEKVRDTVRQNATLEEIVQEQAMVIAQLTDGMAGMPPGMAPPPQPMGAPGMGGAEQKVAAGGLGGQVAKAQTPMTSYGQRLAERSKPDINAVSDRAKPR